MSTLAEKLDQARPTAGRAQCMLRRHLHWRDGAPMFAVLHRDDAGPLRVRVSRPGKVEVWVRVGKRDGDCVMELES